MKANLECIYCILSKADSHIKTIEADAEKRYEFMKKIFSLIGQCENNVTAPYLSKLVNDIFYDQYGVEDNYTDVKDKYNRYIMSMGANILDNVKNSKDPLMSALKYAIAGNFIDFGAMDEVKTDELNALIESADKQTVDQKQYDSFKNDLFKAKQLVYLIDNSGEIGFDKIFIETIKNSYRDICITAVVRGKPVFNDATMEDAIQTGLCDLVKVLGNGMDVPGTQLDMVNNQTLEAIDNADLVISKGQGNFETLYGCGKNIYYLFLCKCDLFTKRFGLEKFKGVFVNEKDIKIQNF